MDPAFAQELEKYGVQFRGGTDENFLTTLLSWVLPALIFFGLWIFLLRRMSMGGMGAGGLMSIGKSKAKIYVEKDTKTTLADVAGVDEAKTEVQEIIDTCDFFLGEGRRLYGQTVPSEMPDKQLFTYRMPVGAAAIITAGNFPVAVPSWYLIPALLCGNTVVWKPAEYAAAAGHALFELIVAGGLPDGVLNLVLACGQGAFAGLEPA